MLAKNQIALNPSLRNLELLYSRKDYFLSVLKAFRVYRADRKKIFNFNSLAFAAIGQ